MRHHEPQRATVATNWQARLALGFADDAGTTRMIERAHAGPLRVQKPLYPENPHICHAIIVHPPGGVVGGDELAIRVRVGTHAAACVTTPGAAKWYRASSPTQQSSQHVDLTVEDGGSLEWLPQETIFFNGAQVELNTVVDLGKNSCYLQIEIFCFGRTASGERFTRGSVFQHTSIRLDGAVVWSEQGSIHGDTAAMTSPFGLAGKTVCASLIAIGHPASASLLSQLREEGAAMVDAGEAFGVTQLRPALVVRYLGNSSEVARRLMMRMWQLLRPGMIGHGATVPRIWNT